MREVSAFPVQRPQTPRPDSRRSRADLMAQALDSPCAVLTPLPHAPPHQMMPRVCSPEAPGVFYLDPFPRCHPHPFPGFLQFLRPLREASLLRAAYPRPRSNSPPGEGLDWERARRSLAQLIENPCLYQ